MDVTQVELGPLRLLCYRHVGPYHEIGPVFDRLMQWASPLGIPMQGVLGLYHDDPGTTPPNELRSDAAIVVPAGYEPPAGDGSPAVAEIPAQTYVKGTYKGSYEGLGDAWPEFMQAISAGGYTPAGTPFEWYVDDCAVTPIEEVRTDLYMPIRV